jgi:fructose-bisphosphate aldolase class II
MDFSLGIFFSFFLLFSPFFSFFFSPPKSAHSDHCARKLLPWFDGMLEADEKYFKEHGEPLFSSHMLDLSEEKKEENIATCVQYLKRMAPLNLLLEMEIGITGGEEDGVSHDDAHSSALYTQPDDIWDVYSALSPISDLFTIAAAFGNVHGVYKAGNVVLRPELLGEHQKYVASKLPKTSEVSAKTQKPVWFVFHGGSGSVSNEIQVALSHGVVKVRYIASNERREMFRELTCFPLSFFSLLFSSLLR